MDTERELLEQLYRAIEAKMDMGEGRLWANKQFVQLSERIFEQTGVLVSASTLKRMLGKVKTDADYVPQLETRNALAEFCGFGHWARFVEQQKYLPTALPSRSTRFRHWLRYIFITLGVVVSMLAVVLFIRYGRTHSKPHVEWNNTYSEGIAPFSCAFHYHIPKQTQAPVHLIIETDTIVLDPALTTYTHYFKLPGYVRAKLVYEGELLGEKEIVIRSQGWKAYAFNSYGMDRVIQVLPSSLNTSEIFVLGTDTFITPQVVKGLGMDINYPYWTEYRNYDRFDVPMDTFYFETWVQNTSRIPTVLCNHICITLTGTGNRARIYFVKPGCSRWLELQFGDSLYSGRDQYLEALSTSLDTMRRVQLQLMGDSATIYLDQQPVFATRFNNNLGLLRGVQFDFIGCGRFEKANWGNGMLDF